MYEQKGFNRPRYVENKVYHRENRIFNKLKQTVTKQEKHHCCVAVDVKFKTVVLKSQTFPPLTFFFFFPGGKGQTEHRLTDRRTRNKETFSTSFSQHGCRTRLAHSHAAGTMQHQKHDTDDFNGERRGMTRERKKKKKENCDVDVLCKCSAFLFLLIDA